MGATILVVFRNEIRDDPISGRLIYLIQNSTGSADVEFMRVGYTALNQFKQGTDWHSSIGDDLLQRFPKDKELLHAYIYEAVYSDVKSEQRISKSITFIPKMRSKWTIKTYHSVTAMLNEKNYWLTKKLRYKQSAISAWRLFISVSPEEKSKKSAQGRIDNLNSN